MRPVVRLARVPVPTSPDVRDALASRWLADAELELLPPRAVEKRRCEFVAGRVAAKVATARLHGVPPTRDTSLTLVAGGEGAGRPVAAGVGCAPLPDTHLSITHSNGVAIAAAANAPVGVDLAPAEPYTRAFDAEAFLDGELDGWRRLLDTPDAPRARAAAFAAKEAALKWLGVGLRMGLHEVRVTPSDLGDARPCADLGVPRRPLVARVHVAAAAPRTGAPLVRLAALDALVYDVGDQVLVALTGAWQAA